jgi:hypothetical protein
MTLWNKVRSNEDILNNVLSEVSHHWLLQNNLEDSIAVNGITLSQAGTPSVFAPLNYWVSLFTGNVGVASSGGIVSSWTSTGSYPTTYKGLGPSDCVFTNWTGQVPPPPVVTLKSTTSYFNAPVPFNHAIVLVFKFGFFPDPQTPTDPAPIYFQFDQNDIKGNGSTSGDEVFRFWGNNLLSLNAQVGVLGPWSTTPTQQTLHDGWHSLIVSRGTETGIYLNGVMIGKAARGVPRPVYDGRLMTLGAQTENRAANMSIFNHGVYAGAMTDAYAAALHSHFLSYWGR